MEFPYQKEKSKLFGEIYRPVGEFEIKTNLGWIPVLAYIDSGADITLLPMSFIGALDIKIEEEDIKDIGGVGGGKVPVIVKEVKMKICDEIFDARVAVALIENIPYLLGREDVFDYFEVCFRQKKKTICFRHEE